MAKPLKNWHHAVIKNSDCIRTAILSLNESSIRLCTVVDQNYILVGTVSDGDIRRAILRGVSLDECVTKIMCHEPVTVNESMSLTEISNLMQERRLLAVPQVSNDNTLLYIFDSTDLVSKNENPAVHVVIMAGGLGTRLRPDTNNCPKPMLPIGGKPILEHIISKAREQGFRKYTISVNYLKQVIIDYFGDGRHFGVEIEYIHEDVPLGTAGSLSLLNNTADYYIVTNGDVICDVDYIGLLDFHLTNRSLATMGVNIRTSVSPYGVVSVDGHRFIDVVEKPTVREFTNAGIYLLNRAAIDMIVPSVKCDMTDLFRRLASLGMQTTIFPLHEYWIDIGRREDLELAAKTVHPL